MSESCVGLRLTRAPLRSSASALAAAVPLEAETIAPAEPPISLDPAGLAATADPHLRLDHTGRPSSSAASTASGTRGF
jgi:hypothetical protein